MRFETRASTEDLNSFGVWDSASASWHAVADRSRIEAERLATDLNLRLNADGERHPGP